MQVRLEHIEALLQQAAQKFIPPAEAVYYARLCLATHLRKAPRMNPLEEAVADLEVWARLETQDYRVVRDQPGMLLLDFQGLAPALKIKSIHDELVHRARNNGIAAAGFGNSAGIITLTPWALGLARREMIGIAMFNGGTNCCVPHGGTRGLFGTLPLAYAVPSEEDPIVLDMALTEIPFFDLKQAKENGASLPPGAAVDSQGRPTTRAAAALDDEGVANLLPLGGGFKGYGLAVLIEILSSVLLGSPPSSRQTPGWHPEEYGALILALDISRFGDPLRFKADLADVCHALRSQSPAEGHGAVVLPGDRGRARVAAALRQESIVVADQLWEKLLKLAE